MSHETTPHSSPAHYATPASTRAAVRKLHYTEIDLSMYDNPRLKSYKEVEVEKEGGEKGEGQKVRGVASEEREESRHRRRQRHGGERKARKKLPHEEILVYVGKEWKELVAEVRNTVECIPSSPSSLHLAIALALATNPSLAL